jgi:hypothetical protein
LEQPKKPGGARDITDLKARLGLNKGAGVPGGPVPGAPPPGAPAPRAPFPGAPAPVPGAPPPGFGVPGAAPPPGFGAPPPMGGAPAPSPFPAPGGAPLGMPAQAPAPHLDPFASMRPPEGRQFDLRPVDDGVPAENVRSGASKAVLVVGLVLFGVGAVGGYGFGGAAVGRRAYNAANASAKKVRTEVEEMQKTITQVNGAIQASLQRGAAEKRPPFSYDPKLIEDLEKLKLDPRPDTSKIFKTDYFRLEDLAVDRLMTYYYDSINLYGEVERFVKKTKADKDSLASFANKQGSEKPATYGVVFDTRGKLVIANLVEVGAPVCKGGECGPDSSIEAFQIRANSGANWSPRKVGTKLEANTLAPLERTPLMEAVMAGSPEQARMEQYKQRLANIALTVQRINQTNKELTEALNKAAARGDLFTF